MSRSGDWTITVKLNIILKHCTLMDIINKITPAYLNTQIELMIYKNRESSELNASVPSNK